MKRWSELKLPRPQKLHLVLAKSDSRENLNNYFKELSSLLTVNNRSGKANNIFTIDGTGISKQHVPPKVVCGDFQAQAVTSPRSKTATIIGGGSAVGNFIPQITASLANGGVIYI